MSFIVHTYACWRRSVYIAFVSVWAGTIALDEIYENVERVFLVASFGFVALAIGPAHIDLLVLCNKYTLQTFIGK